MILVSYKLSPEVMLQELAVNGLLVTPVLTANPREGMLRAARGEACWLVWDSLTPSSSLE